MRQPHNNPRILFAWPGLSGFYGPCWHFLQEECGAKLKCVSAIGPGRDLSRAYNTDKCLNGIDIVFPPLDKSFDAVQMRNDVLAFAPDIMFITGWSVPVNRFLATDSAFQGIKKVICFDMPWQWSFRKFAAKFALFRYLRNFDAAFVPGLSAARYARWLGFGGKRPVITGSLPVDMPFFQTGNDKCPMGNVQGAMTGASSSGGKTGGAFSNSRTQKSFLYVGRYSQEKGVDILADAYRRYCAEVENPWRLDCVGAGEQAECLANIAGLTDLGFRQPYELPEIYSSHSAFILPSRSESWGVAMAEATAGGLPVICTDACGGRFDLVREEGDCKNGYVVPAESPVALAEAMAKMHRLAEDEFSRMSSNSRKLGEPFSVRKWAERVLHIVEDVGGR